MSLFSLSLSDHPEINLFPFPPHLRGCVIIIKNEIASSLSLLAMTKIQIKSVIASDRRERGNLIKIITTHSHEGGGSGPAPRRVQDRALNLTWFRAAPLPREAVS